jgi:predicted transcriptional regulator YdeE
LLEPAWIDRYTGYRYYTLEQLPRLNRILALKDLGFTLDQIQQLLREDLSGAELRGMMRMKHAELEQRIQEGQMRLTRVKARLRQIEQEGTMPAYEVVLKSVSSQWVVGIRDVIPSFHSVSKLFDELRAFLRVQQMTPDPAKPYLVVYYDAEYRDQGVDVEVAAPCIKGLWGTSRVAVHELPGIETMACVVHQGEYEGLSQAHNALMAWIESNGYRAAGPNRDVYLQGREPRADGARRSDWPRLVTELQFPVERKPLSTFVKLWKEKHVMEPKIVTKKAFTVVGMKYHGKNENNEIPQLWGEFQPRMAEVKNKAEPEVCYGVCGNTDAEGEFDYVAGFEVESDADVPAGMVPWQVPEQRYAVFPCTIGTIKDAYQYAFETWLPQSGFKLGDGPDFEYYDDSFDPKAEDPSLTIYVPIK